MIGVVRMEIKPNGHWKHEENVIKEIEEVIDELGHFPTNNDLTKLNKKYLRTPISKHGGFSHFREKMGYKAITRPNGYWCVEENVIVELTKVIEELGHFPTNNELRKIGDNGLTTAISDNGGFSYFREKMGYKAITRPKGYWDVEENVIKELEEVIDELGHFPLQLELTKIGNSSLACAISKHGTINYFREKMGYEIKIAQKGHWKQEKNVIKTLEKMIDELGHFPTQSELSEIEKGGMLSAISKNGGFSYFREKMGYDAISKPNGYWTEENVIKELEEVIDELGHFPTNREMNEIGKSSLIFAIHKCGSTNYFREKMGYEIIQKDHGYWDVEENVIKELERVIEELGYFPTTTEISKIGNSSITIGINKHGGVNYFRKRMGHEILRFGSGYWTEENIIKELENVIEELDHFPTHSEMNGVGKSGLSHAINRHNGISYYWNVFGVDITEKQRKTSKLMSYINKRGKDSEKIVKEMIRSWSKAHGLPTPQYNVKLAKSKIIEFVCETNKRIGIDVTNTKSKNGSAIRHKWKHKKYQLHLDELWIVVFSDVYNDVNYIKFNNRSPDNVKIMSIETFMEELDISVDENMEFKINVYNECTFHTKDILKQNMPEKKPLSRVFKIRPDIRIKSKKRK